MLSENCGVVGAFSLDHHNVIPIIIDCLRSLQHRGQEAWGIAIPNKEPFKQLGLVSSYADHFNNVVRKYTSHAGIGHVRYSTFGKSSIENAQPLKVKDLCVAHNGTIANVEELSNMVGGCTFTPQTMSDTLIAAKRLVEHLSNTMNIKDSIKIVKQEMIGSICFRFSKRNKYLYYCIRILCFFCSRCLLSKRYRTRRINQTKYKWLRE